METAFLELMSYRKFTMQAVASNEGQFKSVGEYARVAEKCRDMADQALTQFRQIIRELETKHRKTISTDPGTSVFVGPTQINVGHAKNPLFVG